MDRNGGAIPRCTIFQCTPPRCTVPLWQLPVCTLHGESLRWRPVAMRFMEMYGVMTGIRYYVSSDLPETPT